MACGSRSRAVASATRFGNFKERINYNESGLMTIGLRIERGVGLQASGHIIMQFLYDHTWSFNSAKAKAASATPTVLAESPAAAAMSPPNSREVEES